MVNITERYSILICIHFSRQIRILFLFYFVLVYLCRSVSVSSVHICGSPVFDLFDFDTHSDVHWLAAPWNSLFMSKKKIREHRMLILLTHWLNGKTTSKPLPNNGMCFWERKKKRICVCLCCVFNSLVFIRR